MESRAIYDLLEQEIVPHYYTRSTDGLPRGWIAVMRASMAATWRRSPRRALRIFLRWIK